MVGSKEMNVTQGEEEVKKEKVGKNKPDEKEDKPDFVLSLLKSVIDSVLFEEVTKVGLNMNEHRGILVKAILEFVGDHEDKPVDLSWLGEAFKAGWKVYREKEDEKATVDVFMIEMNNELSIPENDSGVSDMWLYTWCSDLTLFSDQSWLCMAL